MMNKTSPSDRSEYPLSDEDGGKLLTEAALLQISFSLDANLSEDDRLRGEGVMVGVATVMSFLTSTDRRFSVDGTREALAAIQEAVKYVTDSEMGTQ